MHYIIKLKEPDSKWIGAWTKKGMIGPGNRGVEFGPRSIVGIRMDVPGAL